MPWPPCKLLKAEGMPQSQEEVIQDSRHGAQEGGDCTISLQLFLFPVPFCHIFYQQEESLDLLPALLGSEGQNQV